MGLKYKASNISLLGSFNLFNGAFRLVRCIWFSILIHMYIRDMVILNMVEYNKISVNQFILNCSLFVFKSQKGQAVTMSCEHESELRVHTNSYRTTLRICSLSLYQSWLASGSLWTLILVTKSSIASLLPTCPHCVICKSNILFLNSLALQSVAHYRRIKSQCECYRWYQGAMEMMMMIIMIITKSLVKIWIHCVEMLHGLASWFNMVHRPYVNRKLRVSEPHGCFVFAFVDIWTPSICHVAAPSSMLYLYQKWKGILGGDMLLPWEPEDIFHILTYWDCRSN